MQRLNPNNLFAIAAMTALLFSSCSKQMTPINHSDKMVNSEILTHSKVHPADVTPAGANIKSSREVIVNQTDGQDLKITKKEVKTAKAGQSKTSKVLATVAKKIKTEFNGQIAAVTRSSANHHIASVSGVEKTQGLGGIAAIFAIAAICMAIFGIMNMGAIFWYLSVILIVAAIVFFLVYLMGKAAAPSHGGE